MSATLPQVMEPLHDFKMKIRNYKCFGEEGARFDALYPINLITGHNNSGKSSLLELVDSVDPIFLLATGP